MQSSSDGVHPPFVMGELAIHPDANEIVGDGPPRRVGPRAMEVLVALAEHPGSVVSKKDLLDRVWTGLFVGDDVLSTAVWELRRALGDDARSPRFIQTVPKRGYRLLVSPRPLRHDGSTTAPVSLDPGAEPARTEPRSRRWPWWVAAAATAVVALVLAARWLSPPAPPVIRGLVVLPFEALSGGSRNQALADGVTDTLTTALAQVDGLRVVSRTTARSYRVPERSIGDIARELGVDVVVEGTLAREDDRIVLNAQLIDAATEDHLWAETYERRFEHLLDLQVEIARSIGAAIADRIEPPTTPLPTVPLPQAVTGSLLRWRVPTGGEIWSGPVRFRDLAIFGSRDGGLYAVRRGDGAVLWRVFLGDEVVGRPLVLDGTVYAAAHDGAVAALDATSGLIRWRHRLETTTETGLAATGGMVVAADEAATVLALDGTSGRMLWQWRGGGGVVGVAVGRASVLVSRFDGAVTALDAVDGAEQLTAPLSDFQIHPVTVDDDRVLVPDPTAVIALAAADGRELWRTPLPGPSPLSLWRDRILVGGAGEAVVALDRSTGAELWRHEAFGEVHAPAASAQVVVAGSHDHHVYGLDPWRGALEWQIKMQSWVTTRPMLADDQVIFGSLDGAVYAVALPPESEVALTVAQREGFRARPAVAADHQRRVDVILDDGQRHRPRLSWRVALDGPVTLAPTIADGTVYACGLEELRALAVADGRERWAVHLAGACGTAPLVLGDLVVVGARDGTLSGLSRRDGSERWRVRTGGDVLSTPVADGGLLLFGSRDGYLYAVERATGAERWRRQLDVIHGAPVVAGDDVLVASRGDTLWALAVADGSIRWSAPTSDWAVADPVLWRDRLLLGSCDGAFQAFSLATGAELWRLETGGDIWYRPVVVGGRVYFGSGDHHLYAADAESGRELWRRRTGNRVWSSVAVWRDLVLAGSHDRHLWAVSAATGAPAWRLATGGIVGSPTVAGDRVAVGSHDGHLYLLELDESTPLR